MGRKEREESKMRSRMVIYGCGSLDDILVLLFCLDFVPLLMLLAPLRTEKSSHGPDIQKALGFFLSLACILHATL